jgi:type 1 fimbria pilin
VGVSLDFDAQYTGALHSGCQAADTVHAGMMGDGSGGAGCILPVSDESQGVVLNLRARLIKTSQNTPMSSNGNITLNGTDLLVSISQQPTVVSSWLMPAVYTEPSCTLMTPKAQYIDFGQVELPADRSRVQALNVEPRPVDIGVRCQPLWDGNQNLYDVAVTFDGTARNDTGNVLATSRADLGVILLPVELNSLKATSGEGITLRSVLPMHYEASQSDDAGSYFARRFLVGLNYYPGAKTGGGAFESVVTYTITVNH